MLFSADHSESLLYLYFHEFYSEVVRIKELVQNNGVVLNQENSAPGVPTTVSQPSPNQISPARVTPSYIHQQLLPILERQRADAAQRGGEYGATLYREAQYLMAALTDEIFLHSLEWDGRDAWREHLMETRLFNSYIAGEKVFRELDKLLKDNNPVYSDVARIYLIALSLGFQGKYRHLPENGDLDNYKHRLYSFITKNNAERLHEYLHHNPNKHIFPDAYSYTIKESKRQELPSLRPWGVALLLTVAGLLVASYFLWHHHIDPVQKITHQILQLQEQ